MKYFLPITFFIFLSASALSAQDAVPETDFLNNVLKECPKEEASFKREFAASAGNVVDAVVYTLDGELRMKGQYMVVGQKLVKHGKFTYFYAGEGVESEGYYEKDVKVGSWKRFTAEGAARPDRYYSPESADFVREVMKG